MPSLYPTHPEPDDDGQQEDATQIDFSYIKMRSRTGHEVYAMTFEQIIFFLDNITEQLEEGEESAMFHFEQIKRILRKYTQNGD